MARYGMVLNLSTCLGCQACIAACSQENQTPYWSGLFRTHVEDVKRGQYPDVSRTFFPRLCMQCQDSPCVSACPTGASHHIEGGMVIVDQEKCIGCGACIIACPYSARYKYEKEDINKAKAIYGADTDQKMPHVDKCTFCYQRLEQGLDPACVATCPGEARIFGDLDDPKSAVAKLVSSGRAQPIGVEFGTKPSVFYIK